MSFHIERHTGGDRQYVAGPFKTQAIADGQLSALAALDPGVTYITISDDTTPDQTVTTAYRADVGVYVASQKAKPKKIGREN